MNNHDTPHLIVKSRYGDVRHFYINASIRMGRVRIHNLNSLRRSNNWIDPDGGPMIGEGFDLGDGWEIDTLFTSTHSTMNADTFLFTIRKSRSGVISSAAELATHNCKVVGSNPASPIVPESTRTPRYSKREFNLFGSISTCIGFIAGVMFTWIMSESGSPWMMHPMSILTALLVFTGTLMGRSIYDNYLSREARNEI